MAYSFFSRHRSALMGCAMLWVMLFHASGLDLHFEFLNSFRASGFGGVDIFILLSAMGLCMSLNRRETDYSAFMKRRAIRVLPSYYIVMIPYTLYLIIALGIPKSALILNSSLLYYWAHSAGAFNWYIAAIMTFYAITPWCFRRLKSFKHRVLATGIAALVSLVVCQILMQDGYWYFMDFFYRVPIFFIGLLVGFFVSADRKFKWQDYAVWALMAICGALYLIIRQNETITAVLRLPLCHVFLFTTVPMCCVIALVLEKLPLRWLSVVLGKIGECSLEIYLLNVSFFAHTGALQRLLPFITNARLLYAVAIVLNLAIGMALHHLITRGVNALGSRRGVA